MSASFNFKSMGSAEEILDWGRENGRWITNEQAVANPQLLCAGDLAVWKGEGKARVGLVIRLSRNGHFHTIEGDTFQQVERRAHCLREPGLSGFLMASNNVACRSIAS